uniref:Clone ZZD1600 mRNA sequence n=1 Tax=Schistosoma japonicum TaxID=6182 RepID=Q86EN1_SCHJA|nr:similar to NM_052875 VPS26 protein homolog [Schistosoma japonicum]
MLSFLGLGQNVDIKVNLLDEEHRRKEEQRSEDGQIHSLPVYYDGENVCGSVNVGLKRGGKLEHQGIKIEFIGQIELYTDRGNREEFVSLCQDLARPGILSHSTSYPFEFLRIEKPYESYCGTNVRLRYFLRVTIQKRIADITKEFELVVHSTLRCSESSDNIPNGTAWGIRHDKFYTIGTSNTISQNIIYKMLSSGRFTSYSLELK